jgi:hypothetical protein
MRRHRVIYWAILLGILAGTIALYYAVAKDQPCIPMKGGLWICTTPPPAGGTP